MGRHGVTTPEAKSRGQQMEADQQAIARPAGIAAVGHNYYTNASNSFSAQMSEAGL